MAKVTVIQVVYNNKSLIKPVFESVFAQTFRDFEFVAVISGNEDGGKEYIRENFPRVKIIDPGFNVGFAKGHNLAFREFDSEFFQLVNPDLIVESDYLEKMLLAFNDPAVGAATGKLYKIGRGKFQFSKEQFKRGKSGFKILDTTGVTINKSGRARDRGQHEFDSGQYDQLTLTPAVSAAGAMYRKSALEKTKVPLNTPAPHHREQRGNFRLNAYNLRAAERFEYFDEDFGSYWEDVDLTWRMTNAGLKCVFQPLAVGYHGRGAASTPGGYKKFWAFVRFHKALPKAVRRLNYKNHIFMYLKNSPRFYPQFFLREFFMLLYVIFFEAGTLRVFPEVLKSVPIMLKKRRLIKALR